MVQNIVFDFNGVILSKETHQVDLDMVELLKELHDFDIDLTLFSNTSKQTISFLDSKFDFLKFFKKTLLVEETGLSKPSNEAFENLLEEIAVEGENVVYIDDNRDNIKQANKYGMHAIHFINEARLRAKLIELAEYDK